MFLYNKGLNKDFDEIALLHYEGLSHFKILKSGDKIYYPNSIISKINIASSKNNLSANFFKDLKLNKYKLLKQIILGKPNELKNIIARIDKNIRIGRYPRILLLTGNRSKLSSFGELIKSIFDYTAFTSKPSRWDAYSLSAAVSIDVCTYCNRNFTFTLTSGKNKVVRPEFDHFFAKSEYPYLALSFYNLIPSCHICNSNLKLSTKFTLTNNIHPYMDSFDELIKFTVVFRKRNKLDIKNSLNSLGISFFYGDLNSFDLKLNARNPSDVKVKKANNNISIFKLEELYNKHKDLVVEMVQNTIIYDDAYINALLSKYEGRLFRNREDVLRHITNNYIADNELAKRSFSKLTKDIHQEFGLRY